MSSGSICRGDRGGQKATQTIWVIDRRLMGKESSSELSREVRSRF
ncbi:hypothetical protein [Phormidium sp. CCY1219]|nr:hypothetical protein [Phormidium sp. CCY1219]